MAPKSSLKLVFFGTPDFAVPSLQKLHIDGWRISMVATAPDKPIGRKQILTPSPVRKIAQDLGLEVQTPINLKDETFWQKFSEIKPDICVVVAYGKLIPQRYLDIPQFGFINLHPSLLPAYRGPSPIQSAILDDCSSTGVSIMLLDTEMDHGPVLSQESWKIPADSTAIECENALAQFGAEILVNTLNEYAQEKITPKPQDHSKATFTKKFTREDGRINWNQSAVQIHNQIRALGDNPGTWTTWNDKTLNIFRTRLSMDTPPQSSIGKVFRLNKDIAVGCADGALIIDELQLEGGKQMLARDFVNGQSTFIGSSF